MFNLVLIFFILLYKYIYTDSYYIDFKTLQKVHLNLSDPKNLVGEWLFSENGEKSYKGNEHEFRLVKVPTNLISITKNYIGISRFVKKIYLDCIDKDLVLVLGKIDDADEVIFNGIKIGETYGKKDKNNVFKNYYSIDRFYFVSKDILNKGENIIEVKVINYFLDGGFFSKDIGIIRNDIFFEDYLDEYKKRTSNENLIYLIFSGIFFSFAIFELLFFIFINNKYDLYLSLCSFSLIIHSFLRLSNRDYLIPLKSDNIAYIDMIFVIITINFIVLFMFSFFKIKYKNINIANIIFGLNLSFILFITFFEELLMKRIFFSMWFVFFIIQLLIILFIIIIKKHSSKIILLFGIIFLITCTFLDVLYDLKILVIFDSYVSVYGFLVFLITIVILVSKNYSNLYKEIKKLNDELEFKVIQRTTELEKMQKKLLLTEKLAAVGTLAGGIAHELNSPLGAILTSVQMLYDETKYIENKDVRENFNEMLSIIESGTKKSKDIISKFLKDSENKNYNKKITVNLVDVIKISTEIIELRENISEIKIEKKFDEDLIVIADDLLLIQAFNEIIINAVEALRESKSSLKIIEISGYKKDRMVIVKIKDNGIGIKDEIKNKIFDPFYTTKNKKGNRGLGLSTVVNILNENDANIDIESSVGKGTTVIITFPEYS